MVFEVATLPYLIGPVDLSDLIKQPPTAIAEFLRNLCGVFRYELFSTRHPAGQSASAAAKLVVVGATFLPEQLYAPYEGGLESSHDDDVDLEDIGACAVDETDGVENGEEDEQAEQTAETVSGGQIAQEQAQVRQREVEEQAAREVEVRLQEEQQHAAVRMQCLARGASSRSRVRELRELRQQALAVRVPPPVQEEIEVPEEAPLPPKPVQPDLSADQPAVTAPSPEKKRPMRSPPKKPTQALPLEDLTVDLVIHGTAVTVQGQFVAEGLMLHVSERQEQLQTKLVLSQDDVTVVIKRVLGDEATFDGLLGVGFTDTVAANVDVTVTNNNAKVVVFTAICESLDLFLSRTNGIMTIKYKPTVLKG